MQAKMSRHRASYWRTVAISSLVAVVAISAALLIGKAAVAQAGPLLWPKLLFALAAGLLSFGAMNAGFLAAAGGLISLHRDALEARGVPYMRRSPRERRSGRLGSAVFSAFHALKSLAGRRQESLDLHPGEPIEIRPLEEILATLDERGEKDSLPFMPEMAAWAGRRVRVLRRVDKWYDWIRNTGLRRMRRTVFLESCRCDGSGHAGCQAGCQLFWKEAWLKRAGSPGGLAYPRPATHESPGDVQRHARAFESKDGEFRFVCQMTRLPEATEPLSWHDPRHHLRDLWTGNVRLGAFLTGRAISFFNFVQKTTGGSRYPMRNPAGSGKPSHAELGLKAGEAVRIKSKSEIEETLDGRYRNRGLWFDPDMFRYCGGTYTVLRRVTRQIDERSGRMLTISNPCIVLDGVTATGEYIAFALLNEPTYWRESWLERAGLNSKKTMP